MSAAAPLATRTSTPRFSLLSPESRPRRGCPRAESGRRAKCGASGLPRAFRGTWSTHVRHRCLREGAPSLQTRLCRTDLVPPRPCAWEASPPSPTPLRSSEARTLPAHPHFWNVHRPRDPTGLSMVSQAGELALLCLLLGLQGSLATGTSGWRVPCKPCEGLSGRWPLRPLLLPGGICTRDPSRSALLLFGQLVPGLGWGHSCDRRHPPATTARRG